MVKINDQYEGTIDELRLYHAAGAVVLFGSIGKRSEIQAFDLARCKPAMADIAVAVGMAF